MIAGDLEHCHSCSVIRKFHLLLQLVAINTPICWVQEALRSSGHNGDGCQPHTADQEDQKAQCLHLRLPRSEEGLRQAALATMGCICLSYSNNPL